MKRRFENLELASYHNDPYNFQSGIAHFGKTRLSPKDRVLIDRGGNGGENLDIYYDLFTDSHAYSQWDRQMSEITSKNWFLEKGGDGEKDQEALEYVEETLKNLSINESDKSEKGYALAKTGVGLDGLTRGLGIALFTGISPAEIIWGDGIDGYPVVNNVKMRDARRFHFESSEKGEVFIKLKTRNNYYDGIYVPDRKFIVFKYDSIPSDDPYGMSVGNMLYYPIQWKKELLSLWLTIVDKYASPTTIGKYDEDISDEEKMEFDRAISNVAREMAISMPSSFSVDFESPNISNVDLLDKLEKLCNAYISKVISGEANTGETTGEGSVRQTVSNSIRVAKAKSFSDLISETLNNSLIKWIVATRYPNQDVNPPKLWRNFGDSNEVLDQLKKIKDLGFNTTLEYVENLTGIPLAKKPVQKSFGM